MTSADSSNLQVAFVGDITLSAFGVPVRIRVGGSGAETLMEHLLEAWAWCGAARGEIVDDTAAVVHAVLDEDEDVITASWERGHRAGPSVLAVSGSVTPAVTFAAIEASRGELLMLHAAAVADPASGRTALLVGPSGAGKSTATRALGTSFAYVTDETVVFAPDLTLAAYPKPVSLFPEGRDWGKEQHSPASLGLLRAPDTLTLGALVLLSRSSEPLAEPVVTPLSTAEAVVRLGEHASYLGELERPLSRLADVVHAAGGAVLVEYAEAASLEPVLAGLLGRPADDDAFRDAADEPAPTLAQLRAAGVVTAHPLLPEGTKQIHRLPVDDLYVEAGAGVVFTGGRLVALSPLGTRILTLLDDEVTGLTALTQALLEEFGHPEEENPLRPTDDVVSDLIANGLVDHVRE